MYITPFGVVPANAQFHRQDCFINPSFLEMAYACNPPANYRCRQSVSLLSGSLRRAPIVDYSDIQDDFVSTWLQGPKICRKSCFLLVEPAKYRPHRPHRLE